MRPDIRRDYIAGQPLRKSEAGPDPYRLFNRWFEEAEATESDPNAMTLATADRNGRPSARVVLLKGIQNGEFVFFTHYTSAKGKDLEENPAGCLCFYWHKLERQVRIFGSVDKISREESKQYFMSRPVESRIGAHASRQSSPVTDREELERLFNEFKEKFKDNVPLPDSWGGYGLKPDSFEFWQGRAGRLHDRLLYERSHPDWRITRLAP